VVIPDCKTKTEKLIHTSVRPSSNGHELHAYLGDENSLGMLGFFFFFFYFFFFFFFFFFFLLLLLNTYLVVSVRSSRDLAVYRSLFRNDGLSQSLRSGLGLTTCDSAHGVLQQLDDVVARLPQDSLMAVSYRSDRREVESWAEMLAWEQRNA